MSRDTDLHDYYYNALSALDGFHKASAEPFAERTIAQKMTTRFLGVYNDQLLSVRSIFSALMARMNEIMHPNQESTVDTRLGPIPTNLPIKEYSWKVHIEKNTALDADKLKEFYGIATESKNHNKEKMKEMIAKLQTIKNTISLLHLSINCAGKLGEITDHPKKNYDELCQKAINTALENISKNITFLNNKIAEKEAADAARANPLQRVEAKIAEEKLTDLLDEDDNDSAEEFIDQLTEFVHLEIKDETSQNQSAKDFANSLKFELRNRGIFLPEGTITVLSQSALLKQYSDAVTKNKTDNGIAVRDFMYHLGSVIAMSQHNTDNLFKEIHKLGIVQDVEAIYLMFQELRAAGTLNVDLPAPANPESKTKQEKIGKTLNELERANDTPSEDINRTVTETVNKFQSLLTLLPDNLKANASQAQKPSAVAGILPSSKTTTEASTTNDIESEFHENIRCINLISEIIAKLNHYSHKKTQESVDDHSTISMKANAEKRQKQTTPADQLASALTNKLKEIIGNLNKNYVKLVQSNQENVRNRSSNTDHNIARLINETDDLFNEWNNDHQYSQAEYNKAVTELGNVRQADANGREQKADKLEEAQTKLQEAHKCKEEINKKVAELIEAISELQTQPLASYPKIAPKDSDIHFTYFCLLANAQSDFLAQRDAAKLVSALHNDGLLDEMLLQRLVSQKNTTILLTFYSLLKESGIIHAHTHNPQKKLEEFWNKLPQPCDTQFITALRVLAEKFDLKSNVEVFPEVISNLGNSSQEKQLTALTKMLEGAKYNQASTLVTILKAAHKDPQIIAHLYDIYHDLVELEDHKRGWIEDFFKNITKVIELIQYSEKRFMEVLRDGLSRPDINPVASAKSFTAFAQSVHDDVNKGWSYHSIDDKFNAEQARGMQASLVGKTEFVAEKSKKDQFIEGQPLDGSQPLKRKNETDGSAPKSKTPYTKDMSGLFWSSNAAFHLSKPHEIPEVKKMPVENAPNLSKLDQKILDLAKLCLRTTPACEIQDEKNTIYMDIGHLTGDSARIYMSQARILQLHELKPIAAEMLDLECELTEAKRREAEDTSGNSTASSSSADENTDSTIEGDRNTSDEIIERIKGVHLKANEIINRSLETIFPSVTAAQRKPKKTTKLTKTYVVSDNDDEEPLPIGSANNNNNNLNDDDDYDYESYESAHNAGSSQYGSFWQQNAAASNSAPNDNHLDGTNSPEHTAAMNK